jgi:hypothetical protein
VPAQGTPRLAAAFANAFGRLETVAERGPPSDIFEALGETLFWLTALAEANRKGKNQTVLAMQWARDRIAHGLIVVEPVSWDDGSGLAMMMPARRGYEWKRRVDVHEIRSARRRGREATEQAYDAIAVGREMLDVIRVAYIEASREP